MMSSKEVESTFEKIKSTIRLMAELICGTGMRVTECMTLRVKDIDIDRPLFVNLDNIPNFSPQILLSATSSRLISEPYILKSYSLLTQLLFLVGPFERCDRFS